MKQSPYGFWQSPIKSDIVTHRGRITSLKLDNLGENESVLFSLNKDGKSGLYEKSSKGPIRRLNDDFPVGGTVGYGGGDFDAKNGNVVFASPGEGLKFRKNARSLITKIVGNGMDCCSPVIYPDSSCFAYICSDDVNDQIAIQQISDTSWPIKWISGADFYMQPVWSSNGRFFAWAEWNNPYMPWQASIVKMAEIDINTKAILNIRTIAGAPWNPASQPAFSPNSEYISFIQSDGNWEGLVLYHISDGAISSVVKGEGFALSVPAFSQGDRSYSWFNDGTQIAFTKINGVNYSICVANIFNRTISNTPLSDLASVSQVAVSQRTNAIYAIVGDTISSSKVVKYDGNSVETIYALDENDFPVDFISQGSEISWKSKDGAPVYGVFFPACNPDQTWYGGSPLIVHVHGGPTGCAGKSFSGEINYFTSRGYAWLEVNYRGSYGYGTDYLASLNGHWGEFDVFDTVSGAEYLAEQGLVDGTRMFVTGGSAGGFTTLNSMIQYPNVFRAGASLYGVSNLYTLLTDTHKLEAHYPDFLVGTLPEADEKYKAWSPVFHAEKIVRPLAVFQGNADNVVPITQSDEIVSKLKGKHIYRVYDGEGHGFRKPESLLDYIQTFSSFLRDCL